MKIEIQKLEIIGKSKLHERFHLKSYQFCIGICLIFNNSKRLKNGKNTEDVEINFSTYFR